MPKIHITSFLRPRGRYKCIEEHQQQQQQSQKQQKQPANVVATTSTSTAIQTQHEEATTSNNKVQLIPTLEFVIKSPQAQHVATTTTTTYAHNKVDNSSYNDDGDASDSRCTFLIATTTATASDTNSSVDNNNYNFDNDDDDDDEQLQQEVNLCRYHNDGDDSTFVDEPTSSISIDMDTYSRTTTTGGGTTSMPTTSASATPSAAAGTSVATTAATTTNSRSAMTAQTTPSSDQSIEEEIEEAIELSEELDEEEILKTGDSLGDSGAQLSEAAGYEAPKSGTVLDSDKSSQSAGRVDRSLDAQFEIDDDQLSGGKLAQHFVLDDEEDDDEEEADDDDDFNISLPMEKSLEHSRHTSSSNAVDDNFAAIAGKLVHSRHESTDDDAADEIERSLSKPQPILGVHSKHDSTDDDADGFNISLTKQQPILGTHSKHDDTDSVDISLNLPKDPKLQQQHSKHDSHELNLVKADELQHESLSNQSTADDVSDFIDDLRQEEDEEQAASISNVLELPLPDDDVSKEGDKSNEKLTQPKESKENSTVKPDKNLSTSLETSVNKAATKMASKELDLVELVGSSPEHSDKDHSIEEIMESNQSIEMTIDDKDLSSLAASFDLHNETLINQLLADTPQQTPQSEKRAEIAGERQIMQVESFNEVIKTTTQITEHKSIRALETLELRPMPVEEENIVEKSGSQEFNKENATKSEQHVLKTSEVTVTYAKSTKLRQDETSVLSSRKSPEATENFETSKQAIKLTALEPKSLNLFKPQPEPDSFEPMSLRPELSDVNIANLTSSTLFAALNKQYQEAKRAHTTSPELDTTLTNIHEEAEEEEDSNDDENALRLMKLRILALKQEQQRDQITTNEPATTTSAEQPSSVNLTTSAGVKQMERVPLTEFSKDVLEDITEESERNSLSTADEQHTLSNRTTSNAAGDESETSGRTLQAPDIDPNTLQFLEQKVGELQQLLAGKDACLASLNQQLETATQRSRDSNGVSCEQPMSSGRDSSSLITNSTEYRTFQEDFTGGPTTDFYLELSKRDELIVKLTDSLQQSLNVREGLQVESEKLSTEVQLLRKQLTEAMDTLRRPMWPRDQESNGGQRISEISMDLISESDDDELERFLTDNEDKVSRNSRERQFSQTRQADDYSREPEANEYTPVQVFSKQIEQFQKYLTPNEVRLFFMVQKKFDDFVCQELEKCKMKHDHELKTLLEQLESEKQEKTDEIKRLLQQHVEKDNLHTKEMEDLRKYFEHKCADLEKQFSDDIFSQKSQQLGVDTSSEGSDLEQMSEEIVAFTATRSKETSPRKRTRAELLQSPSHRQMTPSSDAKHDASNFSIEIAELKNFYQNKIHELQRQHDEKIRKLSEKLKYYENRYPEDDFMSTVKSNNNNLSATTDTSDTSHQSITTQVRDPNTSLIIIDQDELNLNNESQVIQKIIEEYEKRLQEQLELARADMVHELENQIQTLLSETTADDHHWPSELILLREKFTAKSQLEIAQLQIKHEDEMSRLKIEYEKQLNRKNKRHTAFDLARDLDQIIGERDDLRELSKTFRHVLVELAKCVVSYEDDLNITLVDEMQKVLANRSIAVTDVIDLQQTLNNSLLNSTLNSTLLSHSKRFVPDVQTLLEVIEDPNLKDFINKNGGDLEDFDLNDCLERLKAEAAYLLQLSEDLGLKHKRRSSESSGGEKNDSCCEAEDGLKISLQHPVHKFMRANSLNEQQLRNVWQMSKPQLLSSLPPDLNRLQLSGESQDDAFSTPGYASELNFQVHELKIRLVKSETDRVKLQHELEHTITRNAELGMELQTLRDQVVQLDSLNRTEFAEGYGQSNSLKSPIRHSAEKSSTSFAQLQERARNILSTPTQQQQQQQQNHDSTVVLLQMIEDFCREGDKVVEWSKKDREDLQAQIDAADKQLKATRQFLEEQAAEREQERDEFLREIERLKLMLRDKEKERSSYEHASKEVEQQESQIRELNQKLNECIAKRDKFEVELKASIDKIFVLREIISELETQVETKALNEHVLGEKVTQLESFINSQSRSNDTLQQEVQSLKAEIGESYQERIRQLEEKLQNVRPTAEQSMVMDQVIEQLRDIEHTLDQKIKVLESLHNSSNSCSLSHTEDVSLHGVAKPLATLPTASSNVLPALGSPLHPSPRQHSLSMEGVQRIVDKLSKHTRVEEAAIKRIRDLDMQITNMRSSCVELQHERDSLQERMSDQMQRISALQSRLEEQRQRAEELQRAGTSDLNIRIHDLQNEVQNLRETLSSRDKQIANMRQQLEKSKVAIDRLESELAAEQHTDRSHVERLEKELQQRNSEVQKLQDKIKSEMVNRLALPDLMETMLADKNEEIDHLKEQLEAKQRELQEMHSSPNSSAGGARGGNVAKEEASTKLSARTLSDILSISEFDEPDVIRRAAAAKLDTPLMVAADGASCLQQTMDTSKEAVANLTHKRIEELAVFSQLHPVNTFDNPHYFQDPNALLTTGKSENNSIVPALVPRQINFSSLTDDSKVKPSSFLFVTPEQAAQNHKTDETQRREEVAQLEQQLREAKTALESVKVEQAALLAAKEQESKAMEEDLVATQLRLGGLEEDLSRKQAEIAELQKESLKLSETQNKLTAKSNEIELLLQKVALLTAERNAKHEALTKQEKNLANYKQNEEQYLRRLEEQEENITRRISELANLQQRHQALSATHAQCAETTQAVHISYKDQLNALNSEIKAKDERLLMLTTKLSIAEDTARQLQQQTISMEQEMEKLRNQQQSDNSSRQLSVDEIAQQLEKELNYSAQLDSNILKAIESEEENNLDRTLVPKEREKTKEATSSVLEQHNTGTDDENFTGERELLNQLEVLRAQIQVEREQAADMRQDLQAEKLHSQDIQEQDVIIIEAMRKRLETVLAQEDALHKQLDQEREKCDRLQAQLTVLQRSDSRRNSALLKSPNESPRRSPRVSDFDADHAERLRSEIKLLSSQQERERERNADLQHSLERERVRFDTELQDRIAYSERLKQEMERLARDKELAEQEVEHLQERLMLQAQEIESLEARIATLQEAETRRTKRRELQRQESAQNLAELQELKAKHDRLETERDALTQSVSLLRFDLERSAAREAKLAEALTNANTCTISPESSIPQQFLQKMKDINVLLAENTKENRQMAETVQFLVEERRQLQKKCEELEQQLGSNVNVSELEERCNHLLGRYLRVESHRKALVYQKRYLKISLQSYQDSEARAMASMVAGGHLLQPPREKKRMFKTVALAIVAIQRMKYIGRIWHTGKRIVSKSVFTITQQKRSQPPTISCAAISSTSPITCDPPPPHTPTSPRYNLLEHRLAPLQTPALLSDLSGGKDCGRTMKWARLQARQQQ